MWSLQGLPSVQRRSVALPRIGFSSGDPAGIGPELMLRLLAEPSFREACVPVVFADAGVLERVAAATGLPQPPRVIPLDDWTREPNADTAMVVDCDAIAAAAVQPGRVNAACGRAAYTYIEECTRSVVAGALDAIATGPIHKESLRLSGVPHAGHTEILTELSGATQSCMMLTAERITVSFVTTHVGYAEVPGLITPERVEHVIELSAQAMKRMRGPDPRIIVCGLNPHAGEGGLFGEGEEERRIAPAVRAARARGIRVDGPVPPDAVFLPSRLDQTECVVCMYHDQGHIPFKHIAWDTGANITLGLPIIRTSVDHGTAFDIAWQGVADPASLFHVVRLTVRLVDRAVLGGGGS